MVWSGITKLIRSVALDNGRCIEVPGLGIFGPKVDKFRTGVRDPLEKGPLTMSKDLTKIGEMVFLANDDFLGLSNYCAMPDGNNCSRFSKADKNKIVELLGTESIYPLNWSSVARSCCTDP